MKILVISNLYPPKVFGGAELLTESLVEELRRRHEVIVLTSDHPDPDPDRLLPWLRLCKPYPEQIRHDAISWIRSAMVSLLNYFSTRSAIRRVNPDVVLVSDLKRLAFSPLVAAQKLRPTATFLHDLNSFNYGPDRSGWRGWLRRFAGRMVHNGPLDVRFALANSLNTLQKQHPQISFKEHRVVGVGIRIPENIQQIVRDHPKGSRPGPILAYLGRIEPSKGVHDILRAAAILVRTPAFHQLEVRIMGFENDPAYRATLDSLAQDLRLHQRVRFLGRVSNHEKYQMLASADLLVFPSDWEEGHGQTYLEAMACDTPCVCSPAGGAAEVLRDGENCLMFNAGDPPALADACSRMLSDHPLRERIAQNAHRMVFSRYTTAAFAARCESALAECRHNGKRSISERQKRRARFRQA